MTDYARGEGQGGYPSRDRTLLSALERINADLVAAIRTRNPVAHATLDMDATLIETEQEGSPLLL